MLEGLIVILFVLACIGGIGTQPFPPSAPAPVPAITTVACPKSARASFARSLANVPAFVARALPSPPRPPLRPTAAYYAMSVNQAMADDPKFQAAEARRKLKLKKGKRDGNYSVGE